MTSSSAIPIADIPSARTIVDVLRWRAAHQGARPACTFLVDGELEEARLTYGQLDARARTIAAHLGTVSQPGDRALVLLPSGLDYVAAFFGCLYAGVIAVPFYPPRRRAAAALDAVIENAGASVALTTADGCERLARSVRGGALQAVAVDRLSADAVAAVDVADRIDEPSIAYLQYTSGSTRRPRGVVVQHGQLLNHAGLVWRGFDQDDRSVVVTWLPLFHDMGLVGSLVAPLAFGCRVVLMSPWHFLTRPARWLTAISRYQATSSGGPNFAYDLCVARVADADRQGLDLRSWSTAFNGAEPVRASTIERFTAAFAPHGFRRSAFRPCYGLAEATLLVTAGGSAGPTLAHVARQRLSTGHVEPVGRAPQAEPDTTTLVGCGAPHGDQRVLVVDAESREPMADGAIGEIWVAGSSVSSRYWREDGDETVFGATTRAGDGPYVRTGDLGFVDAGELFVTGRLADLVIVRGRNYFPADIERAIQECHPALQSARASAFTADEGDDLIVLYEVPRGAAAEEVPRFGDAIRERVATEFELTASSIVPVRFGSLPRTSSGKIMAHMCKRLFLQGELAALPVPERAASPPLLERMRNTVAAMLNVTPSAVDVDRTFADCGLSSLQLAELAGAIERDTERAVEPAAFYAHPTLAALATHLATLEHPTTTERVTPIVDAHDDVAIVGLACRFPGAPDADAFWALLQSGTDAIAEVPPDRWDADASYDPSMTRPGTTNSKWGGFLPRVDLFDAAFFGIGDREAEAMDPQQRLLLEASWDALEDAGIPIERVQGTRTGVFVGISTNDYARTADAAQTQASLYWCTGSAFSMAANRVSFALDLKGPSMAVDTACSSSLVALHLACRSLRSGESELALVGGVNVMLSPDITINMSQAGATSADGRCKAFDASADGLVRGEGVGMVVLKPFRRAIADADRIYAVVKGTAINQDGATNGLTAPNPQAQAAVLQAAYDDAGVEPCSVQYVETHGPGTMLGDPLELQALATVVSGASRRDVCRIGSVKTNIGHLEAAAGIAALIKTALALSHRQMPPSLHFRTPNPRIPFGDLKLSVVTSLDAWPPLDDGARRAGVSAFGFGGTNVHAVMESAPSRQSIDADRLPIDPFDILVLSARSRPALKATAAAYGEYLTRTDASVAEVTRAAERRSRHSQRLAIVGRSLPEMAQRLAGFVDDTPDRLVYWGEPVSDAAAGPVFAFSGFESVPAGSVGELLQQPAFRRSVEMCDAMTRRLIGWSVAESFARTPDAGETNPGLIAGQMQLLTLQISAASLWRAWGVEPAAVVGHSVGEIAAAHVAGAIDLAGAFDVVFHRSRLLDAHMSRTGRPGAMAAVGLSPSDTRDELARFDEAIEIAAHNSPTLTVCAGEQDVLQRFLDRVCGAGVRGRMLDLPGPGHSSFVDPLRQQLTESLAALTARPSRVPIFSTATGARCDGARLDGDHWGHHLRAPVLFVEAVDATSAAGHRLFLEIGVQGALSACIAGVLRAANQRGVAVPTFREQTPPHKSLASAAAQLAVSGYPVTWGRDDAVTPWLPLPRYPWEHRRHWRAAPPRTADLRSPARATFAGRLAASIDHATPHPLLGIRLPGPPSSRSWQRDVHAGVEWLRDHVVGDVALMPAAAYLALAVEAARDASGVADLVLEDVEFERALFVLPQETRVLQTTLQTDDNGGWRFFVDAGPADQAAETNGWMRLASGRVRVAERAGADNRSTLAELRAGPLTPRDPGALYDGFRARGIAYGPSFATVDALWQIDGNEALATIAGGGGGSSVVEPGVLDACLQPMAATIPVDERAVAGAAAGPAFLPARIRRVRVMGDVRNRLWTHIVRQPVSSPGRPFAADATIFTESGRVVATVEGFAVAPLERERSFAPLHVTWQPRAATPTAARAGRWIVVAGGDAIGTELVRLMREAGVDAELVADADHVHHAIDGTPPVAGIVDLRPTAAGPADGDGQHVASEVARVCAGVLDLLRVATARNDLEPPAIWVVTKSAVAVSADETPSAVQHPLWALARTAAVEEPRFWGGIVDVEARGSDVESARILCATFVDRDDEDQIAWRSGKRYVARLAPAAIDSTSGASTPIRPSSTYLVTGGFGELGCQVANWLVQQGARRLILLGRTPLSPRDTWQGLPHDEVPRAVAMIRALEARGASVHVAEVDVASAPALTAWVDRFRREAWPDIAGVLHLAGTVGAAALRDVTAETLREHFASKIAGAWNLHRCLGAAPLDFFVLFSSGSALLGSPGIGAYATANGFLDGLAAMRRADGLPALSINWGFWSESGMATRVLQAEPGRTAPRGMRGLTNRDALDALQRLIATRHASIGIMPFDWDEWADAHPATASRRYLRLLTTARTQAVDELSLDRDAVLGAPRDDRAGIVERYLAARIARILQVDPSAIHRDEPLTHLGIDSLMAVELKNRVEADLRISVPIVALLQGGSIAKLASVVLDTMLGTAATAHAQDLQPSPIESLSDEEARSMLQQLHRLPASTVAAWIDGLAATEETGPWA